MDNNQYNGQAKILPVGTVLHGKYEIESVLGVGGFGITYSALDTVLQTRVAVKEYFPSSIVSRTNDNKTVSLNSEASLNFFRHGLERFLVEARDVAKFNHNPNIVSVFDYFEENSTAYMVMEYLSGMTLKQYYKAMNGNIPNEALYNIATSVLYALSIIHANGLIHRDISPDNIYMCEDGTIKIIDFGAAKEDMKGDTRTVSIVLKQGYAPIEQYSSKTEIGPWTDIYAFGATLYYLATGVKPEVSIDRAISDNVCPPKNINQNMTDSMNRVIMKAISVKAQDRYQSAYDMSLALTNQNSNPANQNVTEDGTVLIHDEMGNNSFNQPNSNVGGTNDFGSINNANSNNISAGNNFGVNNAGNGTNPNINKGASVSEQAEKKKNKFILPIVIAVIIAVIAAVAAIAISKNKNDDSDEKDEKTTVAESTSSTEDKTDTTVEATEDSNDAELESLLIENALEVLNTKDYVNMDIVSDLSVDMNDQATMDNFGFSPSDVNKDSLDIIINITGNETADSDTSHSTMNIVVNMAGYEETTSSEEYSQIDGSIKKNYEYDSDIQKWVYSEQSYQEGKEQLQSDIISDVSVQKTEIGYTLTGKLNADYVSDKMNEDSDMSKFADLMKNANIKATVKYDLLKNMTDIYLNLENTVQDDGIAVNAFTVTLIVVEVNKDKNLDIPSNVTDNCISENSSADSTESQTTEATTEASSEETASTNTNDLDTNADAKYLMDDDGNKLVYVNIIIPDAPYNKTENDTVIFQGKDAYVEYGLYLNHKSKHDAHINISANETMHVIEEGETLTTDDGVEVVGSTFTWDDNFGEFAILTREMPAGRIMYVACQYDPEKINWDLEYMKNMLGDDYLIFE